MSTLVLNVNEEQEKVLETLLQYMNVSFERVSSSDDFWDSLTLYEKERIQRGLTDAQEGRYSPAQSFLNDLLQK
ncbi:MAG: hypothetical protein EAZ91_17385 [Cytophagales bacterium]|nr:MAG: hypothetical protein EAZ91_17385 [Cytophagales bacterium]